MITELLGLAGSGALGSVAGMISDGLQAKREQKNLELKLRLSQEARLNGQAADYLTSDTGFVTSWQYGASFMYLTAIYGACCFICLWWPNVELLTFNPDNQPKKISVLFGLLAYDWNPSKVFHITTGGVGYALLHPLAFQIGTVITGINPLARAK